MAANDQVRILRATISRDGKVSATELNNILRELSTMVARLEGRLGKSLLRDGIEVSSDSTPPLVASQNGFNTSYGELSFSGDQATATNLTKGAAVAPEYNPPQNVAQAKDTVALVFRMDREGFHFYANTDLTPGQDYGLSEVATIEPDGSLSATFPTLRIVATSPESLANATYTALTFDLAEIDTFDSGFTSGTSFTVPSAGLYSIVGSVGIDSSAVGMRALGSSLNDVTNSTNGLLQFTRLAPANGDSTYLQSVTVASLAAGDQISLKAYQNSGGPLNTATFDSGPRWVGPSLEIVRLGN